MESFNEFFKKLFMMFGKVYTYVIGVLMGTFGIAITDGLLDKLIVMFTIITIAVFADFFLKFLHVLFISNTERVQSKKIGTTVMKLIAVYIPFTVLALVTLVSYELYPLVSGILEGATFALTVVVVTRELLSLLETAEAMGLPGARKIMDIINSLPDLFTKKGGK